MFEKVNPGHPDKMADRIAGALVDMAYAADPNARIAVEVLLGHDKCFIITESNVWLHQKEVEEKVFLISDILSTQLVQRPQDHILEANEKGATVRCGDNGIFRGVPLKEEEIALTDIADKLWNLYSMDGKYISNQDGLVICQSCAHEEDLKEMWPQATINPLGYWTGGPEVDSGATNRKLGSDMGESATGGGLHGKDLTKADVSVNIYAWLKAQATGQVVELSCAIGDEFVDGRPYQEIVDIARMYITLIGGFEKFAEWGLIRPSTEWFDKAIRAGFPYIQKYE